MRKELMDANFSMEKQQALYKELHLLYTKSKQKPNEVQFAICYQLPLSLVTKIVTHVVSSLRILPTEKPLKPLTKKEHIVVVKKLVENVRLLPLSPIIQLSTTQTYQCAHLFGGLTIHIDQLLEQNPYSLSPLFVPLVGTIGLSSIYDSWKKSSFDVVFFPTIADISRLFPTNIFPNEADDLLASINKLGYFP